MSTSAPSAARTVRADRSARFTRPVTAYVVSGGNGVPGVVTPIRTATNTAGAPIMVPMGHSSAITPNGRTAYVPNGVPRTVTPIRTATNTAGPPISVGNNPRAIAVTPGRQDRLRLQRR